MQTQSMWLANLRFHELSYPRFNKAMHCLQYHILHGRGINLDVDYIRIYISTNHHYSYTSAKFCILLYNPTNLSDFTSLNTKVGCNLNCTRFVSTSSISFIRNWINSIACCILRIWFWCRTFKLFSEFIKAVPILSLKTSILPNKNFVRRFYIW